MNDTLLVCGFERLRDLEGDLQRVFRRDRSALDSIRERLAFDEFKNEKAVSVGLFEIVDRAMLG